jgi:hypothetical protein
VHQSATTCLAKLKQPRAATAIAVYQHDVQSALFY